MRFLASIAFYQDTRTNSLLYFFRCDHMKTLLVNINLLLHKIPMICLNISAELNYCYYYYYEENKWNEEIRLLSDYVSWEKKIISILSISSILALPRYIIFSTYNCMCLCGGFCGNVWLRDIMSQSEKEFLFLLFFSLFQLTW